MKTFISDMGTEYKNSIINDLCKYFEIKNMTSTAHHHQTVGTVERSHRTFHEYIRSYISIDKIIKWDVWLKYFVYCFNTTSSMAHDYCPYELVFGKTSNLPKQFCSYPKVLNMNTPNKSSSSQVGNSTRRSVAPTAYENC